MSQCDSVPVTRVGQSQPYRQNSRRGYSLGGWKFPKMVRRYAPLAAGHLAPYADRLCALRAVDGPGPAGGTFAAQPANEKAPATSQGLEGLARPAGFEPP